MFQEIMSVLLPFVCGVIAGVVVAYPRGYRYGYAQAKKLLPGMVDAAIRETFNVGEGSENGNTNQAPR